jgi:hypothetical protein
MISGGDRVFLILGAGLGDVDRMVMMMRLCRRRIQESWAGLLLSLRGIESIESGMSPSVAETSSPRQPW